MFDDQPVLFAYLFGSHARGLAHTRSDVDVAVYVDPKASTDRAGRFELSLRLSSEVERGAYTGPIDEVVILNDVSLRFAGRVVRDRVVIYSRDEPARVRYETATTSAFLDFELHLQPLVDQHLAAVARGEG